MCVKRFHALKFFSSIRAYLKVTEFLGLSSISLTENSAYKRDYKSHLLAAFYVLLILSTLIFQQFTEIQDLSNIHSILLKINNFTNVVRLLIIYTQSITDANAFIKTLEQFDVFEEKLSRYPQYDFNEIQVGAKFTKTLVLSIILETLKEFLLVFAFYENYNVFFVANIIFTSTIASVSKSLFSIWLSVLENRYHLLNRAIADLTINNDFVRSFSKLLDLRKELNEIFFALSGLFQLQLLSHFVVFFFEGFIGAYDMFRTVLQMYNYNFVYFSRTLRIQVTLCLDFYLLVYSSHNLHTESSETIEILCEKNFARGDEHLQRVVLAAIYEIKEDNLDVSVCGLFNIDYPMVYVIFTTITNYCYVVLPMETTSVIQQE